MKLWLPFLILALCPPAALSAEQATAIPPERQIAMQRQAAKFVVRPALEEHECSPHTNARCNTTVSDTVNIFGCATDSGWYLNFHAISFSVPTVLTVTMRATTYSPTVVLFNSVPEIVVANNGPYGGSATITTTVQPGNYLIAVGPGEKFLTGNYTLTLNCATVSTPPPPPTGNCSTTTGILCLNANRFAVSVNWRDYSNNTGTGRAVPVRSDSGYFWFFNDTNIELVIKVLDGRTVNGYFWVFYGALSDVEYTITVRDTQTGATKTYFNARGTIGSGRDVTAFR